MNHHTNNRYKSRSPRTNTTRNVILLVIIVLVIVIASSVAASFFLNPERQVEAKFTALVGDYYENVFYDQMEKSASYEGNPEKALSPYQTTGLAPLTLRQLLLYDEVKTSDAANYLLKYCDENETSVTLYPEAPYEKTSYHAKYTYSCNFQ